MLTGKQRSYLKKKAHAIKPLAQLGKDGISEAFLTQLKKDLELHELVKVNVLDNSSCSAKEAANEVCKKIGAEYVQAIGNKFTIYKEAEEDPKIELPKK